MTARMLSEKLQQNIVNVSSSISKLIRTKEINYVEINWEVARKHFGYDKITRKMRIFFCKELSVDYICKELNISKSSIIHSDLF